MISFIQCMCMAVRLLIHLNFKYIHLVQLNVNYKVQYVDTYKYD